MNEETKASLNKFLKEREERIKNMTLDEARAYFVDSSERIISVAKDENVYNYETQQIENVFMRKDFEAKELAIKALEQQPNRCDSCIHSEEWDGSNCYECVKGMADNFEAQRTGMRDATEEERKSVKDYVESISKPTGVNFNELLRDCGTCKHNTGIDCGQYPCNECNRRTHPLYEPKIVQPTEAVSREQAKKFLYEEIERLHDDGLYDCFSRIIDDMYNELPSVTPTNEDIKEAYLKGYDYGVKDWFKSKTQPSEDAVSRKRVIILIDEASEVHPYKVVGDYDTYSDYNQGWSDACDWLYANIEGIPPVTPERPKGKWNFIGDQMFECSSCKRTYTQNQFEELRIYITDDLLPKFCPNCGSYNGGEEDEVSD